jgi:Cd2+/Zn2+-exporting ATPase
MVRSYRLKDLDCANCAMKIGDAVGALAGVKNAQVHFAAQRLTVEFAGEPALEIETQIRDTVRSIEPETQVFAWQEQTAGDVIREEDGKRKEYIRSFMAAGASLILLAAGVFLKPVWPLGETLLLIAAYLLVGFPVVKASFMRLKSGQTLDETLLMTIATLGAWALNEGMEAAAVMLFYRVGETLQDMAVLKGRSDIRALSKLVSDTAHVVLREVVDMPTSAVQPGDILEVRSGERIPVDGEIVQGLSALDLSALTGESVPVNCEPGDKVLSGSLNTGALIRILCEKPASESTVARILRLTREEAAKKAAPERFLGRFAAVYTPAVVGVAALVFLLPPILGLGSFAEWGYRALLLLMISCPCALVLSVPLGYVAGMGDSARRGLLIKGGAALEALAKIDALALDKTGTLTEGVFRLQAVHPAKGIQMDQLMEPALFAESKAQHPLARSILASPAAQEWLSSHTFAQMPEAYEEIPGKGVRVRENGREILCGSKNMLEENGIEIPAEHAADQVHTAQNGQYLGSFHLNDALRKEAPAVLAALQKLKIGSVTVLTGDSEKGAQAVKSLPNISKVYTGLLPEGKVGAVREIASSGRHVAFVGDGINDAPVLAAAHVGIAMGGIGSQAAMEAADCVLAAGTLSALPEGIATARRTAFIVRANVVIALVIKLLVMALGIMGLAGMWLAVAADVGVSLLCVLLTGVIRLRKKPRKA